MNVFIMRFLFLIIVVLSFMACNNPGSDNRIVSKSSDTTMAAVADSLNVAETELQTGKKEIIIKDSSHYSDEFIQKLQELGYEKFELKDSLFIINDEDTAYFSGIPKIGKQLVLTGKQDDLSITLTVKRINYTTIDYHIEMLDSDGAIHNETGQADVSTGFFLGEESDVSEKTGTSYFVTEFADYKSADCYAYIRLGYEEETGPYLSGKLKKNCNGEIQDIELDNFATLIEK